MLEPVTNADVLAAIKDANAEFENFRRRYDERFAALEAKQNRDRLSGAGELPARRSPFAGTHDFLFGSKVRDAALEGKAGVSGAINNQGGYLLTADQDAFYAPLLVSESVAIAAGVPFVPTGAAELKVPTESTDPVAYWTGEGDAITESTPIWNLGSVIPRKLASLIGIPNEMLQAGETSPYIARLIEQRMTRSMSGELDRVIFEGNGVAEPKGMRATSGINEVSMGDNGATFSNLDPFSDAIAEVGNDGAEANAIVMHWRDWKNLAKLKEATASNNKPLLQESAGSAGQRVERRIYGLPVYLTNRLSTTEVQGSSGAVCSSAYVFDVRWIAFAQRMALTIAVDSSRLFNQDKSEVRAILRGNTVILQPTAICRIKGIKAS